MKKLFIEFTNGDFYIGQFHLYKDNNRDLLSPNYSCSNYHDAMYFIPASYWIRHEDSDELYTTASVVKIKELNEEEYLTYK